MNITNEDYKNIWDELKKGYPRNLTDEALFKYKNRVEILLEIERRGLDHTKEYNFSIFGNIIFNIKYYTSEKETVKRIAEMNPDVYKNAIFVEINVWNEIVSKCSYSQLID